MSDYFTLEQLPNEVFHELFEYFDIYELYKTFSQLNVRFNSLIQNYQYLQITLYTPEEIINRVNQYFLMKTKTLIINHVKNLYDPMRYISFEHIRCLILCQPTREQWNSILPVHFPNLERLYLINSRFIYRTEQLCSLIFSNAFPYLHSCSIPHIAYEINNQWTPSLNLRSLQITIWDIRVYIQILHTCPNLNRLKIKLNGGNNYENFSLYKSTMKHSTLRYLALYCSSSITCEFIDSILSVVSNLNQFLLNANNPQPSHISVNTLATILEDRTPKLSRINIDLSLPHNFCSKEQIQTNHLLFKSCKIQSELNRPTRLLIVGSV